MLLDTTATTNSIKKTNPMLSKNILAIIASCCIMTSCSSQSDDVTAWMTKTREETKSQTPPPPPPSLPTIPTYTPPVATGLNAFNPNRLRVGTQGGNAPNLNRPKQILENFSLENLSYVGTLTAKNKPASAFIKAGEHVYTAHIGNYLGQNYGQITSITPQELVISELVEDSYGNWVTRKNTLPLSTPNITDTPAQ